MPKYTREGGSPRRESRVPLDAQVELKFENFQGFLDEIAANISNGGMFVKGTNPPPVGTVVDFSLKLQDDYALIQGRGEVAWVRARDAGPEAPAGVGIRFLKLLEPSGELIKRIVQKYEDEGGEAFDLERGEPIPASTPEAILEPDSETDLDLDPVDLYLDQPLEEAPPPLEAIIFTPPDPEQAPVAMTREEEVEEEEEAEEAMAAPPPPIRSHARPAAVLAGDRPPPSHRPSGLGRSGRPSFLLVFLLIVSAFLGAAGYRFTEMLVEWGTGYASEAEQASRVRDIPPPQTLQAAPLPAQPATADPGDADAEDLTAAADPVAVGPDPGGAATGGTPLTQVRLITWRPTEDGPGTHIILRGNGTFDLDNLVQARLPSRLVLKLRHIDWPLRDPALNVDSPEVRRIRTGFHPKPGGNELHIVLDLVDDAVQVTDLRVEGTDVHIFLRR